MLILIHGDVEREWGLKIRKRIRRQAIAGNEGEKVEVGEGIFGISSPEKDGIRMFSCFI